MKIEIPDFILARERIQFICGESWPRTAKPCGGGGLMVHLLLIVGPGFVLSGGKKVTFHLKHWVFFHCIY